MHCKVNAGKKKSLRPKPEANDYSMKFKKMTDGIFEAPIVKCGHISPKLGNLPNPLLALHVIIVIKKVRRSSGVTNY